MIYTKKTLNKVDVEGKKVILRLDLNVPMSHGQILDDNRIKAPLPTIQHLLDKNSKINILSYPGRSVNQGVDQEGCLPKTAWPPTCSESERLIY